ncbi:hypothetical protein LEP1GSC083_4696 [Leptospira interrogans serovar Pyrogenes str. L0374]|uniref:Uncharacterized protein n=1 Tax=Leptospira interrogans serovar Pyrogenes str. L0374 TaxID=1049928 RepID=M6K8B4_LEPIR|nr:hypothetical protein LEP1GSC148_2309 [Leptospira interrogans serovar Canicola str. LT1962]EMN28015.1 hypothetical protein LEP1GSC083_4696 [Leptospira interrogans serovar Pyrogenes str. L0374]
MQGEISRFLLFFVALIFFSVLFGHLRSLNKEYLYADSSFSKEESFLEQKSFSSKIFSFVKGIIMFQSSKTTSGESVWKHIFSRILPTLHLAVFSVGWGSFFAVTLALVSSKKEEGIFKNIFLFLSNWILSTPVFVVGVVLLLIFLYNWNGFLLAVTNLGIVLMWFYQELLWALEFGLEFISLLLALLKLN